MLHCTISLVHRTYIPYSLRFLFPLIISPTVSFITLFIIIQFSYSTFPNLHFSFLFPIPTIHRTNFHSFLVNPPIKDLKCTTHNFFTHSLLFPSIHSLFNFTLSLSFTIQFLLILLTIHLHDTLIFDPSFSFIYFNFYLSSINPPNTSTKKSRL